MSLVVNMFVFFYLPELLPPLSSNPEAMASPAPLKGDRIVRVLDCGRKGIGGFPAAFLVESNKRIVSRTRDLRFALFAGFFEMVGPNGPLIILSDLTGLGLVLPMLPSFASSRFGSDIGLGIRDLPDLEERPLNPGEVAVRLASLKGDPRQLVRQLVHPEWC